MILPDVSAGLGLRRELLDPLQDLPAGKLDFMEVAPENWIGLGGRMAKRFQYYAERYPVFLHGLSLDIGGSAPLNRDLLESIKAFMQRHDCPIYSEHLSYSGDQGQLYDLMPIPFTEEAVYYVADRVRQVQDILGQRIALENISYYLTPAADMSESEFINAVLSEADCDFLLDVNNIYVNSINHCYDPRQFLAELPLERARYIHVAGHYKEADDLMVDTHGAEIIDPVWALLAAAYQHCGPLPTLLERDFNIPPVAELLREIDHIRRIQDSTPQLMNGGQALQSALN